VSTVSGRDFTPNLWTDVVGFVAGAALEGSVLNLSDASISGRGLITNLKQCGSVSVCRIAERRIVRTGAIRRRGPPWP